MILVPTGNDEMDRRINGIPHPSIIMMEGDHGTGKTIVAGQFAFGFLNQGMKGVFVTTEGLTMDFITKMRSVQIDVYKYLNKGLTVAPVNVMGFRWNSVLAWRLLSRFAQYVQSQKKCDFAIIDSLTVMASFPNQLQVLDFIRNCRLLTQRGTTTIVTVHPGALPEVLLTEMKSMVDVYFRLSAVSIGGRRLKSLERIKSTGGFGGSDIVSFDIDPAIGLKVVPLSVSKS
jgi:archaeal flagellar protein FlaH